MRLNLPRGDKVVAMTTKKDGDIVVVTEQGVLIHIWYDPGMEEYIFDWL
jgi:hypothetical protein